MSNKRVDKHHKVMDAENAEGGDVIFQDLWTRLREILTVGSLTDSHNIQQIS